METAEEDPFAALDILVKALSEMAKPYGYVVEAALDFCAPPALNIKRPDGELMAMMCIMFPGNICPLLSGQEVRRGGACLEVQVTV